SLKQAYLLRELQKDKGLDVPDVTGDQFIILDEEKWKNRWEREEVQKYNNTKTIKEIGRIQHKIIYIMSQFDLNDIIEIRPEAGSVYIYSSSEPFTEEGEMDFERLKNWLACYGLPLYQIHASGHVMPHQLAEVIRRVSPKKLIPVHTEYPETFKKYFGKNIDVELPTKNQTMKLL
ncbi:MAG: MBL fold metallo-hydrolase RNA specificity domain-containing protein, partial [Candidatus Jordarchaeaceae archaeon]